MVAVSLVLTNVDFPTTLAIGWHDSPASRTLNADQINLTASLSSVSHLTGIDYAVSEESNLILKSLESLGSL